MNHPQTLHNLVAFENKTMEFASEPHANKKVAVRIIGDKIHINIDGIPFTGKTDRPLVHRLGNNIFRTMCAYNQIQYVWDKMIKEGNCSTLEKKIENMLRNKSFTIRYYTEGDSTRKIYGLYTKKFVEVNQLDFREAFITAAQETNLLNSMSTFGHDPYGHIIEKFPTRFKNNKTKYECILRYGNNNGYSAFQISYYREVIVCTNGLKEYVENRFKWRHINNETIETFVQRVLAMGLQNQMDLEEQMQQAALRPLNNELLNTFMDNLKTTLIFKQKIRDQIVVESKLVGNTEWALSQALTNIATHDKEMNDKTGVKFRNIGTKIISTSLEEINKEAEKWNKKK